MTLDLLATLREKGSFTAFLELCACAELFDELAGPERLTVFAPTDAAFARLSRAAVVALYSGPPELVIDVAEHHLVKGLVRSAPGLRWLETMQGSLLTLDAQRVDRAPILQHDLECANGVVHVIDDVLCPSYGAHRLGFEGRVAKFLEDFADCVRRSPPFPHLLRAS